MPTVSIEKDLKPVLDPLGLDIFVGGKDSVPKEDLKPEEEEAIARCVEMVARSLKKTVPSIVDDWRSHLEAFKVFGGVAKAIFPETKPISFPSQPGHIGVVPLFPQIIKYAATASSSAPAYTSYTTNKWEISLTAGTAAYIFGDGTNFYKADPQTSEHMLLVICQDGVLEVGSTPKIDQFQIYTEVSRGLGVYAAQPLADISIEPGKTIYQYPTLGIIPVYPDLGIMWGFMPKYSGTAVIKLLGIAFVEHDYLASLKWVS